MTERGASGHGRLRYAAEHKNLDEPLRDFIKCKGGINRCASRFARRLGRGSFQLADLAPEKRVHPAGISTLALARKYDRAGAATNGLLEARVTLGDSKGAAAA